MERSQRQVQSASKAKRSAGEHDSDGGGTPIDVDSGGVSATHLGALMSAGGNTQMAQLSAGDARHKGGSHIKKVAGDAKGKTSTRRAGQAKSAATSSQVKEKTSVSKMSGPGPNALSIHDGWGVCDTETVTPTLQVGKEGTTYKVTGVDFVGEYSIIAELLAGVTEVQGPGGDTTADNWKKQRDDLDALGEVHDVAWYMLQAVVDHEAVHETRMAPALEAVEATMAAKFTSLSVEASESVTDEASALEAIEALPAYATAVSELRDIWDAKYVELITGDHDTLTPTAEHAVVDPMIEKIEEWAEGEGLTGDGGGDGDAGAGTDG